MYMFWVRVTWKCYRVFALRTSPKFCGTIQIFLFCSIVLKLCISRLHTEVTFPTTKLLGVKYGLDAAGASHLCKGNMLALCHGVMYADKTFLARSQLCFLMKYHGRISHAFCLLSLQVPKNVILFMIFTRWSEKSQMKWFSLSKNCSGAT